MLGRGAEQLFCRGSEELDLLPEDARLSPDDYASTSGEFVTLDVRPKPQYDAMHTPGLPPDIQDAQFCSL